MKPQPPVTKMVSIPGFGAIVVKKVKNLKMRRKDLRWVRAGKGDRDVCSRHDPWVKWLLDSGTVYFWHRVCYTLVPLAPSIQVLQSLREGPQLIFSLNLTLPRKTCSSSAAECANRRGYLMVLLCGAHCCYDSMNKNCTQKIDTVTLPILSHCRFWFALLPKAVGVCVADRSWDWIFQVLCAAATAQRNIPWVIFFWVNVGKIWRMNVQVNTWLLYYSFRTG